MQRKVIVMKKILKFILESILKLIITLFLWQIVTCFILEKIEISENVENNIWWICLGAVWLIYEDVKDKIKSKQ